MASPTTTDVNANSSNNNSEASTQTRIEMPPTQPESVPAPRAPLNLTVPQAAIPQAMSRSQPRRLTLSSTGDTANDYLYFDTNTFKQVKRLYGGMLCVAIAYSCTMIIMMVVLYKTLPQSMSALHGSSPFASGPLISGNNPKLTYRSFGSLATAGSQPNEADHALEMLSNDHQSLFKDIAAGRLNNGATAEAATTGGILRSHDGRMVTHETARNYLDQVIAINFLTLILYSLAFYAAHRELYTLTLAFTSTLSFTMMFSVVKIFVEGVHFPNNFMSLLLRVSIVFVALVYLGQLRRKQHFIRNMWLSPNSLLNHPALRSSQMTPNQTAQLIRQFLAASASSSVGGVGGGASTSFKTDEDIMAEYQDLPPNYEEALRCPVPNDGAQAATVTSPPPGSIIPLQTLSSSSLQPSRVSVNSLTLQGPPPSFDELSTSRVSLNDFSEVTISVPVSSSSESQLSGKTAPSEAATIITVSK